MGHQNFVIDVRQELLSNTV